MQLVEEFEERANARYGTSTGRRDVASAAETIIRRNKLIVNSPRQPYLNPGQFKYLRHAESGSMAAVTIVLWYLGKIFRLDAFLLLFYPLPTLYIAARWGLSDADSTLCVILLLSFLLQGPFFTKSYFFNTGLLTLTYSRMLWHRRSWYVSLLCGALAKAVGVVLSLFWYALILRENTWTLITEQITQLLNGTIAKIVQLKVKLFADATAASLPAPVVHIAYVRIGVVAFIAVYSLYHVFCTYIFASLILIKVAERAPLARVPKDLPLLKRILRLDRVKRFDEL